LRLLTLFFVRTISCLCEAHGVVVSLGHVTYDGSCGDTLVDELIQFVLTQGGANDVDKL